MYILFETMTIVITSNLSLRFLRILTEAVAYFPCAMLQQNSKYQNEFQKSSINFYLLIATTA